MEADDQVDPDGAESAKAAEKAYVAGLITRGEAARPDEHGNLPAGATHELIDDGQGNLTARRKRFSAF